jgi:hypothetical protein
MFANGVSTVRETTWVTGSMAACVVIALLGYVARVMV